MMCSRLSFAYLSSHERAEIYARIPWHYTITVAPHRQHIDDTMFAVWILKQPFVKLSIAFPMQFAQFQMCLKRFRKKSNTFVVYCVNKAEVAGKSGLLSMNRWKRTTEFACSAGSLDIWQRKCSYSSHMCHPFLRNVRRNIPSNSTQMQTTRTFSSCRWLKLKMWHSENEWMGRWFARTHTQKTITSKI